MSEVVDTSGQYLEQFLKEHNLSEIPQPIRNDFHDFLLFRAAARSTYLIMSEGTFVHGLGQNYLPKENLITLIEHSRLNINGLNGGTVKAWNYTETQPKEHKKLLGMDQKALVQFLDSTTDSLFSVYRQNSEILGKKISLPYPCTGQDAVTRMTVAESFHASRLAEFCDSANIPRTAAMKKVRG